MKKSISGIGVRTISFECALFLERGRALFFLLFLALFLIFMFAGASLFEIQMINKQMKTAIG